jgi:predicted ATP-dependent serine protease
MKPFTYTCEHCGSEYNITAPGKYECSICNNTFIIEDLQQQEQLHIQEQQKKLEEIRQKTTEQKKTEQKTIEQKKTEKENQKKKPKHKGELAEIIIRLLIYISVAVMFVGFVGIAAGKKGYEIIFTLGIISSISNFILFQFFKLLQAIEYNTRKED